MVSFFVPLNPFDARNAPILFLRHLYIYWIHVLRIMQEIMVMKFEKYLQLTYTFLAYLI